MKRTEGSSSQEGCFGKRRMQRWRGQRGCQTERELGFYASQTQSMLGLHFNYSVMQTQVLGPHIQTVITRINYGQSVSISGLAGAVSLAGSGSGFWSVEGGNWQIAAGLIKHSNATLHLQEEIISVSRVEDHYELTSAEGNHYHCDVAVVATPLDELNISFFPPISIPSRKLQHTYTTFVHGLINPAYFSFTLASEIPDLVGTVESPDLPFSCVAVQKKISEDDKVYKIFSRSPMEDDLLDKIFSTRKDTIRINWAAYPHFEAPEVFAPFVLDGFHLYYINAFENAASTMETGDRSCGG